MRKSKKLIAMVLSILMVCSVFSGLSVSATGLKTVSVNSTFNTHTVAPGAVITQTISLANFSQDVTDVSQAVVSGIRGFTIDIAYDSTNFDAVVTATGATVGFKDYGGTPLIDDMTFVKTNNNLRVVYADTDNGFTPAIEGAVLVVTYTAEPTAEVRDYTFSVGSTEAVSFIDCSYLGTPTVPPTPEEVALRTVTATFPAAETITVSNSASSAKDMTSFSIDGNVGTINQVAKTIAVTVPYGTSPSSLVATFTASANSTVKVGTTTQTSGITANNFTSPVTYTVVAENNSTQNYTVTVTVVAVDGLPKTVSVTNTYDNQTVARGAVITQTIALADFSLVFKGIRAFVIDIAYDSTNFVAVVAPFPGSATAGSRTIGGQLTNEISVNLSTDNLRVVYADTSDTTDLTPATAGNILVVTYTAKANAVVGGYSFSVGSSETLSFIDCSNPASDATPEHVAGRTVTPNFTLAEKTITVSNSASAAKDMTSFSIGDNVGTIDQGAKTIAVTVPYGTSPVGLVATFASSLASTVKVGVVLQESGTTANNFTSPVTYTVVAEDTSAKDYTVTVAVAVAVDFGSWTIVGTQIRNFVASTTVATTVSDFLAGISFTPDVTVKILDKNLFDITGSPTSAMGTGTKVQILINGTLNNEYVVMIRGDVDGNGLLDGADLLKLLRYTIGLESITDVYLIAANVNGDIGGTIDGTDLLLLKRYTISLETINQQ
jgi:hypothetical protein